MLRSLNITNYAIIDHVELTFSNRLTTITGETGAGKSILVGALSLLLGSRSDSTTLYDKSKKCIVEGIFDIGEYQISDFFAENELDFEPECTVRREISAQGKSRAFVNDSPVTLEVLRELSSLLVDLHRQHETLDLASDTFQLDVVDAMAGHLDRVRSFTEGHRQLRTLESELSKTRELSVKAQQELDYQQFQLKELVDAKLTAGEQEVLEAELGVLSHQEEITEALKSVEKIMSEGDASLLHLLKTIESTLRRPAEYDQRLQPLLQRITSSRIELDDVRNDLSRLTQASDRDPGRLQSVTDRLDQIFRLQKKHRLNSIPELISRRDELSESIKAIGNLDERLVGLEAEVIQRTSALTTQAELLSEGRSVAAAELQKQVAVLLGAVGLPNAKMKVELGTNVGVLGPRGFDRIRFLFSANPGSAPVEIKKVASGGELSRLMLIIKSLIANKASLPTLIFDEIDEGVSGEVARKIGSMMRDLATSHQVICITHLPQIAASGHAHYFVYKEVKAGRTITFVRSLDTTERVREIAKMLSGDEPTKAAIENARELLTLN